jgi:RNA polymerase sigma-70 factor (ECF subfamily)
MDRSDAADAAGETATGPSDTTLLRAVAAGDEAALGAIYDRHAPLLLAIARRILGSSGDAEDALQDAFFQVWKQAGNYDPRRSSVPTWLVLITRSRCLDRLRSRSSAGAALDRLGAEPRPRHESPRAVESVISSQRSRRVAQELELLPVEQREVLDLAFYGGLTQSEIAAQTGIPLGTVKTRTLLAMRKLRAALRDDIRELL